MSELVNYYKHLPKELQPKVVKNLGFKKHHVTFPCRILVSGKSNSGKTLSIMNFLRLAGAQFNKITIITKKIEPLYEMMKLKNKDCCDIIELGEDGAVFPPIDSFDGTLQNFVIFDDLVNSEFMKDCKEFAIRGRKTKPYPLNFCFITQDYFKTDSMIRKNMTHAWIFKPASRNEERSIEKDFPVIKEIPKAWSLLNKKKETDVNSFLNIDTESGVVRINFGNPIYIP